MSGRTDVSFGGPDGGGCPSEEIPPSGFEEEIR
jgi:hypothetical protein